eukprot:CAMPEP_0115056568 /NCGR_PEP_ID=MMETSP0227-20121206/5267_1 /TAXON_ID=89957 /ORGANISM="Polarella glacialis, Strain CCMP 1383" /LENGTH=985 /DNA_ID=CAMNT_0002441259 /DNA_START=191 /DNA_END=3148 /DNA_ORIENTATION=+
MNSSPTVQGARAHPVEDLSGPVVRIDSNDSCARHQSSFGVGTKAFVGNDAVKSSSSDFHAPGGKKKGALVGVFVPTCENMWGVLIFLRFYYIVGQAGIWQTLCAVTLSFAAACCTTSSMCSLASSGGLVSGGGPYFMISRALGPVIGATIGSMKWLAITMLAVLECLGAVEALALAVPALVFPGYKQAIGSGFMALLAFIVWGGINVVTKMGVFFAFVVVFTLFSYYFGLFTMGSRLDDLSPADSKWITGLSVETFKANWGPHYDANTDFGVILSLFFPCFTGILSGANRADVLKNPPKNIRQGTFAAIIFSYVLYVSFFVLWGSVADYRYLQGAVGRRLSEGAMPAEASRNIVNTIVWNPFSNAAFVGIIIASLSQALQCLIVAPRLLQSMAKDKLLPILSPLEKLNSRAEPARALLFTYVVAGLLVLIGELELVAPLLTMCFLMTYAFMNCSCFALTWLKSPTWRPSWIHQRRWRLLNLLSSGSGVVICLAIMLLVNPLWALAACSLAGGLYFYVNWNVEVKEWGSAMDGIKFRVALKALIQLEDSQYQHVNWRPQMLLLYRIGRGQTGEHHEEILRFSSQLRKGRGFCVVACVLESEEHDQAARDQASAEKEVIKGIMKAEGIEGFAEVVVAPNWNEGTNYIIQLTGIGGLVPNTVMLEWPGSGSLGLMDDTTAQDFVKILSHANSADKAVLAAKGLTDMPQEELAEGTIDVWWMIHDGGFLILLSWILMQHRTWRKCHIRVFTLAEDVSAEEAKAAGERLTKTLRERNLFDVDVEVILADDEMIEPYTYDWTLRVEDRHQFLSRLHPGTGRVEHRESIPLEIDDLFALEEDGLHSEPRSDEDSVAEASRGHVLVSDCRAEHPGSATRSIRHHCLGASSSPPVATGFLLQAEGAEVAPQALPTSVAQRTPPSASLDSCRKLNQMILSRSSKAQLVVMNLPDQWGTDRDAARDFMTYCDTLTHALSRVLFVHSSGHEVFDISY